MAGKRSREPHLLPVLYSGAGSPLGNIRSVGQANGRAATNTTLGSKGPETPVRSSSKKAALYADVLTGKNTPGNLLGSGSSASSPGHGVTLVARSTLEKDTDTPPTTPRKRLVAQGLQESNASDWGHSPQTDSDMTPPGPSAQERGESALSPGDVLHSLLRKAAQSNSPVSAAHAAGRPASPQGSSDSKGHDSPSTSRGGLRLPLPPKVDRIVRSPAAAPSSPESAAASDNAPSPPLSPEAANAADVDEEDAPAPANAQEDAGGAAAGAQAPAPADAPAPAPAPNAPPPQAAQPPAQAPLRPDNRMPITPVMAAKFCAEIVKAPKPKKPVRFMPKTQRRAAMQAYVIPAMIAAHRQLTKSDGPTATKHALSQLMAVPNKLRTDESVADLAAAKPKRRAPYMPDGLGRMDAQIPDRVKRAAKAIHDGDMRKAMSSLEDEGGKAPPTAQSILLAASKHPLSPLPQAQVTARDIVRVPEIKAKLVRRIVKAAKRGRAAGQSGWTWELVQMAASSREGITALTKLVNALATSVTDPHDTLLTCGLTLLDKKGGGIRPVAVAEPIVSLVSKCLAAVIAKKAETRFQPIQFAGGLSRGIECAIMQVKLALGKHKDNVMCSLDISNAFNEGLRAPMMSSIKAHFPEVYPWLSYMYRQPTPLKLDGVRVFDSASGQRQGDALSMLAFCEVIHPILLEAKRGIKDLELVAYADDVKVIGSRASCEAFEAKFSTLCLRRGLRANPGKTEWYDPSSDDGTEVFGAPIGRPAFINSHVDEKLAKIRSQADLCVNALAFFGFVQEADQLLRRSVRPALDAYLRLVDVHKDKLDATNKLLLDHTRKILDAPELSFEQLRHRPRFGGLSFGPARNQAGESSLKVKKALRGFGVKLDTYAERMQAFLHRTGSAAPAPPSPPAEPAEAELALTPFAVLPQWINSTEQTVDPDTYRAAMKLHLGLAKTSAQQTGSRQSAPVLPHMVNVSQTWISLDITTPSPTSLAPNHMERAVAPLPAIPRLHISYAYMRDVVQSEFRLKSWRQSVAAAARSARMVVEV